MIGAIPPFLHLLLECGTLICTKAAFIGFVKAGSLLTK
jgi:hypothetical protein